MIAAPARNRVRWSALTRRWGPLAAALLAFVALSIAVIPRIHVHGSARTATADLDLGQAIPELRTRGGIVRGAYGLVASPFSTGTARLAVPRLVPRAGERVQLRVVTGPGLVRGALALTLIDRSDTRIPIPGGGKPVAVTSMMRAGQVRLAVRATNSTAQAQLALDQVRVVAAPPATAPSAGRGEVALWVMLALLVVVAALDRVRRDAPIVVAGGITAFVVWPSIRASGGEPTGSRAWDAAVHASWLDLDHGVISGTFGSVSSLAVQLFHALTPITGTGAGGARTASMLVGVGAVAVIFVLARRVGGYAGAAAAVTCALLCDAFRNSLASGASVVATVLAAALFLIAAHAALVRRDRRSMTLLGVAGAVAILAEPTWWPGVLVTIFMLALRPRPRGATARSALLTALLALVIASLPSWISIADRSGGDVNGDSALRATAARNVEFVGRGHGAPSSRAALAGNPAAGSKVGLAEYVLGDHSPSVVVGGTISGAYHAMAATGARPDTKLVGLLAFVVELAGVVVLLLLPGLRLLVLIPALLALIPWFFVSRGAIDGFAANAAFWPAMLIGAATVGYIAAGAVRARLDVSAAVRGAITLAWTRRARPRRVHLTQ